jgi:hypothetical protein
MTSAQPEYWTGWAEPWLHYVPVSVSYLDLWDTLAFFRGGLYGEDAHDAEARHIAYEGRSFARDHMRWEDLEAYQYRLMLEYARLYNLDRTEGLAPSKADFTGDTSVEPQWRS